MAKVPLKTPQEPEKEDLRINLKEAFTYHRDALGTVFKIPVNFGAIFAALIAVYITMSSVNPPNSELQSMRIWVVLGGIGTSLYAIFAQWLAIKSYLLSGRVYLRPAKRLLWLENTSEAGLKKRANLEKQVVIALYIPCLVYIGVWLGILLKNHVILVVK